MSASLSANNTSFDRPAGVVAFCDIKFLPYYIAASILSLVVVGVVEHVCWLGARRGRKLLPSSWKIGGAVVGAVFSVVDVVLGAKVAACDEPYWWLLLMGLACSFLLKVMGIGRCCYEIVSWL